MERFCMSKLVAIVLGGTWAHRELVRQLQGRGYYVVLLDYLPSPPAVELADEHIQVSTLDHDKVLDVARTLGARLVISSNVDQANLVACSVSHALGLYFPYSEEAARCATDKVLMKRRMIESGITTSKFISGRSWEDFADMNLSFPVVVKPADCNSSKGVLKVSSTSDLKEAVGAALTLSRSNQAIVEEYVVGREFQLDAYIKGGKAVAIVACERLVVREGIEMYGAVYSNAIGQALVEQLRELAEKIASASNLDNCPILLQAIMDRGDLSVIEYATRFSGGEVHRLATKLGGHNIIDYAIASALGECVGCESVPVNHFYGVCFLYAKACEFGWVSGLEYVAAHEKVEYVHVYKSQGDRLNGQLISSNRVSVVVVKSNSSEEAIELAVQLAQMMDLKDVNGHSVMRNDIYENQITTIA